MSMPGFITALRSEAKYVLGDTMQLWKRNLLAYRRTPDLLVFSTIQPVMFVLLFSFVFGGAIQGFSIALSQKWVYDRRWGLLVAKRFYSNRPPGILDVPHEQPMQWGAANLPDPYNPLGAKGIGEAAQGAGSGAVVNAIADALAQEGGDFFRSPITRDMILTQLEQAALGHDRLSAHV